MESERLETYRLRAGLASFRRKVAKAELVIAEALARCRNPYVAWSGGKDSTAMLHLVMRQRPDVPAVCCQTDIELPDNLEIVPLVTKALGVNLILIRPEVSAWETLKRFGGPFGQVNVASSAVDRLCFFEPIFEVVKECGFDLVFLGLRAEESRARRVNRRRRGLLYMAKGRGIMTCTPLADWDGTDVFAYLVANGIPISAVYSKTRFHPEPERVREGWWVPGDQKAATGGVVWLRYYYPELYRRLAAEFPAVAGVM